MLRPSTTHLYVCVTVKKSERREASQHGSLFVKPGSASFHKTRSSVLLSHPDGEPFFPSMFTDPYQLSSWSSRRVPQHAFTGSTLNFVIHLSLGVQALLRGCHVPARGPLSPEPPWLPTIVALSSAMCLQDTPRFQSRSLTASIHCAIPIQQVTLKLDAQTVLQGARVVSTKFQHRSYKKIRALHLMDSSSMPSVSFSLSMFVLQLATPCTLPNPLFRKLPCRPEALFWSLDPKTIHAPAKTTCARRFLKLVRDLVNYTGEKVTRFKCALRDCVGTPVARVRMCWVHKVFAHSQLEPKKIRKVTERQQRRTSGLPVTATLRVIASGGVTHVRRAILTRSHGMDVRSQVRKLSGANVAALARPDTSLRTTALSSMPKSKAMLHKDAVCWAHLLMAWSSASAELKAAAVRALDNDFKILLPHFRFFSRCPSPWGRVWPSYDKVPLLQTVMAKLLILAASSRIR